MYNDVDVDDITTDVDTLDDAIYNIDFIQKRIKYMYKDKYDEWQLCLFLCLSLRTLPHRYHISRTSWRRCLKYYTVEQSIHFT